MYKNTTRGEFQMNDEKNKLQEYSVPLEWSMWGRIKIKAHSEEEAVKIAFGSETPLPEGNYIDNSLMIDETGVIEIKDI